MTRTNQDGTPPRPAEAEHPATAAPTVFRPPRLRPRLPLGVVGLIVLAFVAGFLGSWAFAASGLTSAGANTITENRDKIVLQEGEVVADVAGSVSPSVVSVLTTRQSRQSFFGVGEQEGAGTGVIISTDGYIMTNKHVIPAGTEKVEVVLADGKQYDDVTVVGRDPLNDLAFLKIQDVGGLPAAKLGDSAAMSVGQKVVAIGNALGQYQTTVTSGIISGIGRPVTAGDGSGESETLENLFQTDAAINPGNSGGPLVNLKGEVIGINTAVAQDAQGIGFAIPINDAKGLIKGVLASGKVQRAYLGIRYLTITPDVAKQLGLSVGQGAYVGNGDNTQTAVLQGSPADKAGLKAGDIITKVNGTELGRSAVLTGLLAQYGPGDTITLTVLRGGKTIELKATLAEYNG